jgi:hypothetical protein
MRTAFTRVLGRRLTLVLLLLAVLLASTAAWAFWAAKSSGTASGHVGDLAAPQISSATPGGGTVTLNWTAVSAPAGGTVSYYVSRDGGTASSACPSSGAPGTQTSCTDAGVSIGSHKYTVTAVWRSWTAKSESTSAQVTSGAATHLVLTPATTTPTAGAADNLTITAKDAANNTVSSYTGSRSLKFSGASTIGPLHPTVSDNSGSPIEFGATAGTTVTFSAGVASVSGTSNGVMTLYKAETASVKVSDGTIDNGSSGTSVTVAAGAAAGFTLSTATRTAGTSFGEELVAKDSSGNTATSYTGARTIAFSGPGSSPNGKAPVLPTVSVTFNSGVGTTTGSALTLYDADEAATLTATQGSISGTSASFVVNATSIASFALGSAPQTAGVAFFESITALDSYGNTATSYTGTKTLSFSGPGSSPEGNAPEYKTSVSFTAGVGASEIKLYKAETPTLKATQATFTGSASFTVSAASAAKLTFSTISTQNAGTAFEPTITAKDSFGNTATSYTGTRTIGFTGPNSSPLGNAPKYPATVSFSAGSGKASSITIYDAGSTSLNASDGTISGASASFTVNALSTTSRFMLSTPSPTAGTALTETVTAADTYGNTTTGYAGTKSISFSGPAKSPNNTSPKYPSQLSFSAGVATTSAITLYAVQTTTLTAKETFGSISGESESFTAASASPSSLSVSTPATQTAGVAFNLSITGAKDPYGNPVGGTQTVSFSGPSSAPDGTTASYPSSTTFAAGEAKVAVTLSDAQTTSIKVTSGTGSNATANFIVNAAPMAGFSLTAVSSTVFVGQGDELTIKAVDDFENTITSYAGSKTLKFSGAKASGTKQPTVSNGSPTPVNFEEPTAITFASGVAKSSSSSGVMKLYAIETAHVVVSEGTLTSSPLNVTVEAAEISSLTMSNHTNGTKGRIEKDDTLTLGFNDQIAANSFCSAWSVNGINHELSGNGVVTVTLTDGSGVSDDTLTVSSTACAIHLGTIDLGSASYVSGGSATFSGNGSSSSTVKYTASSEKLTIELGGQGGTGTTKTVSSSAAKLTPDVNLTDEFGNVFPAFTTATTAQF